MKIHPQIISQIESKTRAGLTKILKKIAKKLAIDLDDIA